MKSAFRNTHILVLLFTLSLLITGCVKKPPVAAPVSPLPPLTATPADKKIVVARVNGTELTRFSLIDMMNRMSAINQQLSTFEPEEATQQRALDQLVLQELALQEAARQGLSVPEIVIDQEMNKIITKLGHEEGYRDFLEKQHLDPVEFRALVERGFLTQLIVSREVLAKVSVLEESNGKLEGNLKAAALNKRRLEWEQSLKKDAKIELMDMSAWRAQKKP